MAGEITITPEQARELLHDVIDGANELLEGYSSLFNALTVLYNQCPKLFAEMQRVVQFPDNNDVQVAVDFYNDLIHEAEYMNDDYLNLLLKDDMSLIETRIPEKGEEAE